MINCEIIREYDRDNDGTISAMEVMETMGADITAEERDGVIEVWKIGEGGVDQLCPPASGDARAVAIPFVLAGVALYLIIKMIWK